MGNFLFYCWQIPTSEHLHAIIADVSSLIVLQVQFLALALSWQRDGDLSLTFDAILLHLMEELCRLSLWQNPMFFLLVNCLFQSEWLQLYGTCPAFKPNPDFCLALQSESGSFRLRGAGLGAETRMFFPPSSSIALILLSSLCFCLICKCSITPASHSISF